MSNNIYILSQPIHTGKTTLLMNWLQTQPVAAGILTPDVNNVRMLYDIATQTYHMLQVDKDYPDDVIQIGKYQFSKVGFEMAQTILLHSTQQGVDWLVVDEVGMLEVRQQTGLEPTLTDVIEMYKTSIAKGNLLLVIRDYLLEEAKAYYKIPDAVVLDKTFFE